MATFSLATNRQWKTEGGESKEDASFHRLIAWDKMGELCAQLLKKGSKVYIQGRLQNNKFVDSKDIERESTEVVVNDMILLDSHLPKTENPVIITEEITTEEVVVS